MKNILLFMMPLLLLGSIYSCKKTTDKPTIIKPSNSDPAVMLNTIFANNTVKSKVVTINAGLGSSFYGISGTRYVFPPNCFMTANGNVVTGNVDIEVAEYLKRGDMIFSKVLPVSDGQPLVSGGEVFVSASQNGQKLLLRNGYIYTADIPPAGGDNSGMKAFLGVPTEDTANNKVNWKEAKKDTLGGGGVAGVVYKGDTISVFTDSIGYCNADRFMSNPNYQSFTVSLAGVTLGDKPAVRAYALYDNYNSVWPMFGAITNGSFSEGHVPDIPVHFVVMTVVNDEFYGGILGATPKNGQTYTVTMTKTDPATFKAQIDKL